MKNLILAVLATTLLISCDTETQLNQTNDKKLYSTIKQEVSILSRITGEYCIVTQIWSGEKEHNGKTMSIEYYEFVGDVSYKDIDKIKKDEYLKAIHYKSKVDSALIFYNNNIR